MAELPRGTVTLVFTDIEGSTRLLASMGSRYEEVLAIHRRLLREAFSSHGGVEVDTQGDALFYAFARAQDAVRGAVAAQRVLASHDFGEGVELRVRMGIHTGEPSLSDEGYVGSDVHLGARISAVAWGGQVVISSATAALVGGDAGEISLRSLGEHTLKDIDDRVELHQVVGPGLEEDFPALRSVSAHPTNLPRTLDLLVGRAEDISQLVSQLGSAGVRMVTVTGPGGVGKTRVALAAGAELLSSFADGVFFVDLSSLSDPSLLVGAVAATLGLSESAGRSLSQTLSDYLVSRQVLLILDNLEHLLAAASDISGLVTSAPSLKVLVTSREPLRIAGEHEVPLAPLGLPSPEADAPEVAAAPAVELFVARARALRPGFELTTDDASSVARICRRVDGLPLAIELAAARTKVLSLPALAYRLEESFAALGQGRRDASDRQRTLRGAISWSYGLLCPAEQTLFRRLGVFAGGWTLEAAEAVSDRGDLSLNLLDGVVSLVDKSLVRAREHEDRFVMLETIRAFAAEKLEASGEEQEIRLAHADYFRALAEKAEPYLVGEEQKEWLDRLEAEHANFRGALQWALDYDPATALSVSAGLWRFWWARGHSTAGRRFLESALELAPTSDLLHARGTYGDSCLAVAQGDYDTARRLAASARDLFESSGDPHGLALSLAQLGWISSLQGDLVTAGELSDAALEVAQAHDDHHAESLALTVLGNVALQEGQTEKSQRIFQETLELSRLIGNTAGMATALGNLGGIAVEAGREEEAKHLLTEGLALAKEIGDIEPGLTCLINLGFAHLLCDDLGPAARYLAESVDTAERAGDEFSLVYCLEGAAAVAFHGALHEDAALLLGAAGAARQRLSLSRSKSERDLYDRLFSRPNVRVEDPSWENNVRIGSSVSIRGATAMARETLKAAIRT